MQLTIGMVCYNALKYTKLSIKSFEQVKTPYQLFVVDGGSTDGTREWLDENKIPNIKHDKNYGGPYAANDIFDHAFKNDGDQLLMVGNDTMTYPGAVDEMVRVMNESGADWVWANEMRVSDFIGLYPQYKKSNLFDEHYCLQKDYFADYTIFKPPDDKYYYRFRPVRDYRNFCLINKSLFDKIGYADVSYWPSGYWEDNDYCRRAYLSNARAVKAEGAWFFHFWSRAAFETDIKDIYGQQLKSSATYYFKKWGGNVSDERFQIPFMEMPLKIDSREYEKDIVEFMLEGAK